MKGTEVDNLSRLRDMSPSTYEQRERARWARRRDLELTEGGELREKPRSAVTAPQGIKFPNVGWE